MVVREASGWISCCCCIWTRLIITDNRDGEMRCAEQERQTDGLWPTWHSYIPWSLRCTNLICRVHVFEPGVCRITNRSSFVYICAPEDSMCQSRRRIQDIWFCKIEWETRASVSWMSQYLRHCLQLFMGQLPCSIGHSASACEAGDKLWLIILQSNANCNYYRGKANYWLIDWMNDFVIPNSDFQAFQGVANYFSTTTPLASQKTYVHITQSPELNFYDLFAESSLLLRIIGSILSPFQLKVDTFQLLPVGEEDFHLRAS